MRHPLATALSLSLLMACGAPRGTDATAARPPAEAFDDAGAAAPDPAQASVADAAAALDVALLVGSWAAGGMDFESATLEADGTYSTFLHDRPFDSGRWTLDGHRLILSSDAYSHAPLENVKVDGANLDAVVDGNRIRWTRIAE